MQKKIYPMLAFTALTVIILIIIAADLGLLAPLLVSLYRVPYADKLGHFLLMGILAFFVVLAAPPQRVRTWLFVLTVGITLEEFSQILFPARNFSWLDISPLKFSFHLISSLTVCVTRRWAGQDNADLTEIILAKNQLRFAGRIPPVRCTLEDGGHHFEREKPPFRDWRSVLP